MLMLLHYCSALEIANDLFDRTDPRANAKNVVLLCASSYAYAVYFKLLCVRYTAILSILLTVSARTIRQ